jgi:hypothetical protein
MDFVNEHLRHYNIPEETADDVRQYYDYIWTKHRGLIYGQEHFKHISDELGNKIKKTKYQNIVPQLDITKNLD